MNISFYRVAEENRTENSEEILEEQNRIGFREYKRSNLSLALSALTAGLEIGFSVLLIGIIYTSFQNHIDDNWLRMMIAAAYPLGFILIIVGHSELFTEHTSLAIIPLLMGKTNIKELLTLWGIVILGNLIGGFLFALIITWIGPERGIITVKAFEKMAVSLMEPDRLLLFGSALIAGWLMGLLSWLVASVNGSFSKITVVVITTFVIGIGNFHHCIVGSVEMLSGLLVSDSVTIGDYLHFLLYAVLGNIVGGALFVSGLKYFQVKAEYPNQK